MKLFLKETGYNSLLCNTYYDETGKVVYKIHTPHHRGGTTGTTTVTKVLSSPDDYSPQFVKRTHAEPAEGLDIASVQDEEYERALELGHDPLDSNAEASSTRVSLPAGEDSEPPAKKSTHIPSTSEPSNSTSDDGSYRFEYIAQIDWNVVKSSRFRFGDGKEVIAKDYLRKETWGPYGRNRVFKGLDGVEYKWILGRWIPELVTHDSSKTRVAKFHRRTLGIFNKSKRAPAYLEIYPEGEHMIDEIFTTFVYIEKLRMEKETGTMFS